MNAAVTVNSGGLINTLTAIGSGSTTTIAGNATTMFGGGTISIAGTVGTLTVSNSATVTISGTATAVKMKSGGSRITVSGSVSELSVESQNVKIVLSNSGRIESIVLFTNGCSITLSDTASYGSVRAGTILTSLTITGSGSSLGYHQFDRDVSNLLISLQGVALSGGTNHAFGLWCSFGINHVGGSPSINLLNNRSLLYFENNVKICSVYPPLNFHKWKPFPWLVSQATCRSP